MRVEKKTKLLPIKLKSVYTIVCIHLSCKLDKFKHISLAVLQSVQGGCPSSVFRNMADHHPCGLEAQSIIQETCPWWSMCHALVSKDGWAAPPP